jgi:hypothetical protein
MSNPYGLTNEQLAAYSAQIVEDRAARAALPKSEDSTAFRERLERDKIAAEQIKFDIRAKEFVQFIRQEGDG